MRTLPPDAPEPHSIRHLGAFAGTCVVWGSTFLAIRFGNDTVPPLWAATLRLLLAGSLLVAIAAIRRVPYPAGASLKGAVSFGFLNLGLNFALLYWGEVRVSSGTAALIFATLPIMTGVVAWLFGVHALDPVKMVSAFVGFGGVALIFAGEVSLGAPTAAIGAILLSALLASISSVILKKLPSASPITTNAVACFVGAAVCFAGSLFLGEPHALPRGAAAWWPIVYLAVAGNLIAFVLYIWLLARWSVTSLATNSLITPVIAVTLGALTRGEALGRFTYLGGLLVLAGVAASLFLSRRTAGTRA
ncbi:MAG TPA: EamA family transporter [Candidatus Eisenbacteria bacterium]|nr:EamA family transporter [Candidatus Eisenbacteria bacterium]